MAKFRDKMVTNKIVFLAVLFLCKIILLVDAATKDSSKNTYQGKHLSIINITNVVNITNVASLPVRLEINEETNIELIHSESGDEIEYVSNITKNNQTRKGNNNQSPEKKTYGIGNFNSEVSPLKYQRRPSNTTANDGNSKKNSLTTDYKKGHGQESQNKTTTTTCCLVIYPPKCNVSECIIQRKKVCWNFCTEEIVILEAPGFPKDKFPKEFIPVNWKNGQFFENITITLIQTDSTGYQGNSPYVDNGYQQQTYSQTPYPYLIPQNIGNGQYQHLNPNNMYNMPRPYQPSGYPYFSPYNFEPRPTLYWCPGPHCPLFMRSY